MGSATRSRLPRLEMGPSSGQRFDCGGRRSFAFTLGFIATARPVACEAINQTNESNIERQSELSNTAALVGCGTTKLPRRQTINFNFQG
jgi:hypothetical protein